MNIQKIFALAAPLRRRRMSQLVRLIPLTSRTRVIDVGGYEGNWRLIEAQPRVVLVNLEDERWTRGRFSKVKGDGRALAYPDQAFDLAYSNSVVEHVGTWADQQAFAREIRRVAPAYYVQTPYRHFPVELHTLTPLAQYFPAWMKARSRWLTVWGWLMRPDAGYVANFWKHNRLLDRREFRALFPDALILEEKVLGLTKSLIAVRLPQGNYAVDCSFRNSRRGVAA